MISHFFLIEAVKLVGKAFDIEFVDSSMLFYFGIVLLFQILSMTIILSRKPYKGSNYRLIRCLAEKISNYGFCCINGYFLNYLSRF